MINRDGTPLFSASELIAMGIIGAALVTIEASGDLAAKVGSIVLEAIKWAL